MTDETVKEWLNALKVGSRVVVKAQTRSRDGVVELIEDGKIWVMYSISQHAYSAISVNLDTGRNDKLRMFIFPLIN